tara:strand:+ start:72 stop:2057 length:1986 start_codon:yes stop_codon:yes gene_type:complete
MADFKVVSDFKPAGDQPQAIDSLSKKILSGERYQTLLGVTGSGKTFTMANIIQEVQRPTLIMSHNKTLAAQLYGELKQLFPNNAVEYFISYYDYYQPEAYMPVTDTFIEKDASINEEIDKLRLKATSSLMSRNDVIVVSSVSCIYGIGSPERYGKSSVSVSLGDSINRRKLLSDLINIHYSRNDMVMERGNVRVRGDIIEVFPAYEDLCIRFELFGDDVDSISRFNVVTGEVHEKLKSTTIFPAKHFVADKETTLGVIDDIRKELVLRLEYMNSNNMLLQAQRLEQRTNFDIEMMIELGYCSGIENYSRYFANRKEGERPFTLIDFFPKRFITFLDESHVTLPQIQGMYNGDRARKMNLVEHGFRLPSALDNRPLKYDEFFGVQNQILFVSATPSHRELGLCQGEIVEQLLRPTGLLDPIVEIRKTEGQIDNLIGEIRSRSKINERVLITTLTKRMSEDLSEYLSSLNIKVRYMHSDISTVDRTKILRDLRLGSFDVLVGINLLREGLDIPEVSLVAVIDADKEGFLRSASSLMQVSGRAARNSNGRVILYADRISKAMSYLIEETEKRREHQNSYNIKNDIVPQTIFKSIDEIMSSTSVADSFIDKEEYKKESYDYGMMSKQDKKDVLNELNILMLEYSNSKDYEKAAKIRDEIETIKNS